MSNRNAVKWNTIAVTIEFGEDGVAGSLPPGDVLERYAKILSAGAPNEIVMQMNEEGHVDKETVEEFLRNSTSVFSMDEKGFYLRPVQFIGMLCMAASRTKLSTLRRGMRATLIQGTTVIEPSRIYLTGGRLNNQSRSLTPQGRSVIKRTQVLTGVNPVQVAIKWLNNGDISCEEMRTLLTVGQSIGVGGDRRFGCGKFKILDMRKVNGHRPPTVEEVVSGKVDVELPAKKSGRGRRKVTA